MDSNTGGIRKALQGHLGELKGKEKNDTVNIKGQSKIILDLLFMYSLGSSLI